MGNLAELTNLHPCLLRQQHKVQCRWRKRIGALYMGGGTSLKLEEELMCATVMLVVVKEHVGHVSHAIL